MADVSSTAASEVDVNVWRAIAGAAVKIPPPNAYVYYFPQGHLQHSDDPLNYNFTLPRPWIPCQVLSLNFLAKHSSDQPYAKFVLHPLPPLGPRPSNNKDENDVVSFVKILTRSDINSGGGFSVPRFCADTILPASDYTANPPVQTLIMRDVHNTAWEFRHIYRGTPRRHMLTAGWTAFVAAKRLVAGDSVVFIKKRWTHELFIGIRRARWFGGGSNEAMEAIATAARGRPFEVAYYPGSGVAEFVVEAEKAKEAMRRRWAAGTRVRMGVEMNDTWKMTCIQGVVVDVGIWCPGSPWRMLRVRWEDSESTQDVSPWEVECTSSTPPIDPHHHPTKRLRHSLEIATQSELHYTPFCCGIQGGRQYQYGPSLANSHPLKLVENSYPGILSPANHNTNAAAPSSSSFQLFGKTIKVSEPRDGGTTHNAVVDTNAHRP